MPRKPHDFQREAIAFAQAASRQLSGLQRAMRTAEDSLAGLQHSLHVPVPKGGSRYTKRTITRPLPSSIFVTAGLSAFRSGVNSSVRSSFSTLTGDSFYTSDAQQNTEFADAYQDAQRFM